MAKFDVDAGKFWIFRLRYNAASCVAALYRMFSAPCPALGGAIRFSGMALHNSIIYAAYVIPNTQLLHNSIWFRWLFVPSVLNSNAEPGIMSKWMSMLPSGPAPKLWNSPQSSSNRLVSQKSRR